MPSSFDRGWRVAILAASGPSLTEVQAAEVAVARAAGRCRVFVCNRTWERIPNADVLYGGDGPLWYSRSAPGSPRFIDQARAGFSGELWTRDAGVALDLGLNAIGSKIGCGLTRDDRVYQGANSGLAMVNLAYLFGMRFGVLVGYDMQRTNGMAHWHGDHSTHMQDDGKMLKQDDPSGWIPFYNVLARAAPMRGVQILNATIETALECFERVTLAQALERFSV